MVYQSIPVTLFVNGSSLRICNAIIHRAWFLAEMTDWMRRIGIVVHGPEFAASFDSWLYGRYGIPTSCQRCDPEAHR